MPVAEVVAAGRIVAALGGVLRPWFRSAVTGGAVAGVGAGRADWLSTEAAARQAAENSGAVGTESRELIVLFARKLAAWSGAALRQITTPNARWQRNRADCTRASAEDAADAARATTGA